MVGGPDERPVGRRLRVVIVGAGFGGVAAARALRNADVEVIVIDQRNHHTFQPLLYQVATAGLDADDVCHATRGIFHRQSNATAVQSRVVDVDFDRRLVITDDGEPVPYDRLVLALGAVTNDYGVPGVEAFTFPLKSAHDALELRSHVLRQYEVADRTTSAVSRDAATTIVVVGGGPTGVETAGGFIELTNQVFSRDFPTAYAAGTKVVLIEGEDRLLGAFSPKLGASAEKKLRSMGVDVKLGTQVSRVQPGQVVLSDGTTISSNTIIWAAGVRAHPFAEHLGLETTAHGRVVVDHHLRLLDRREVFVVGDLAAPPAESDGPVPQMAPAATQGGKHAATVIAAEVAGNRGLSSPFRYVDKGSMATIGRNSAVVEFPNGLRVRGFLGWVAWLMLHVVMLVGYRNRANVLVNWAWSYLTHDRGSRLIIEPDAPQLTQPSELRSVKVR